MIVPAKPTQLLSPSRKFSLLSGDAAKRLIALAAVILLAIVISPAASDGSRIFLDPGNLTDILRQVSVIGILSLGMTFVILTAGIDLSVGSLLALSSSSVALILTRSVFPWPTAWAIMAAAILAIAATGLVGFANGLVIAKLRIQP